MVFTTGQLLGMALFAVCVLCFGGALAWLDHAQHRSGLLETQAIDAGAIPAPETPPAKPSARRKSAGRSTRKHGR
jgi:hypothetical protein